MGVRGQTMGGPVMGGTRSSPASGNHHGNHSNDIGDHNNHGGATVRTYRHGSPAPGRVSSTSQSSSSRGIKAGV